MMVIGIRKSRWGSTDKHVKENNFPVRGLKGKTGNKNKKEMDRLNLDLSKFFEKMLDEAEVPATCLVRDLTGVGLRAGEEEKIELPTHMTNRGLYKQFYWQQGWRLVSDVKGNYTCSPRPYDTEFLEGSQCKELTAWSSFENYWKDKYPNLNIRASSENICSECHIVVICYKYRTFRELTRYGSVFFGPEISKLLNTIRGNDTSDKVEEDGDADDVTFLRAGLEHVVAEKVRREIHR